VQLMLHSHHLFHAAGRGVATGGDGGDTSPHPPVGETGGMSPPGIDDLPTFLTGMKNYEIENRPL